jgi:hypothetical protein
MTEQTWAQELNTGLGSLAEELDRARDGGVPDWPAIMDRVKVLGASVVSAAGKYDGHMRDAGGKLANASKTIAALQTQVQQLQSQIKPAGVGAAPGTGLGQSQTVYISAGATAGIAAGALLLGGVGGYAAKAFLDTRKKKKAAEAEAAEADARANEELEEPEDPEPRPKRIARKTRG